MTVGRKVVSWGGHNINDDIDYSTEILTRTELPNSPVAQSVRTERPSEFPVHVHGQPVAKVFQLEINVLDDFEANWTQLQQWFDWRLGQQYLVTSDLAGANLRRMLCFPLEFKVTQGIETSSINFGSVTLEAAYGQWESVALDAIADETGVGDTDTFNVDNDGNARSYPAFTVTPTAAKADTDGYTLRRRLIMASRTELPMGDPVKDGGYPVDLTANALDTDALDTANKVRPDLFDLAVSLNGELQNRWPDPATDNATTKLWTNVALRAMKSATLAANINGVVDTLSVARPYPFDMDDWPKAGGFIYIGTECLMYTSRDAGNLYGLTRGIRNTTAAAHTAGDTILWVEHRFLDVLYGFASASDPDPPDDEKPLIDMAASTNILHVLSSAFLNARDRRSRALQRRHTDAGVGSLHVTQHEDGVSLVFTNNQASAGKPALNDAVMEFPVPLATTGPTLDMNVELTMLLRAYVEDMEGYESRLIDQDYTATPLTAENFPLPAVAKKLRINGGIGVVTGNDTATSSQTFTDGATTPEIYQRTAVRFVLQQQTKISQIAIQVAKAAGATGDLRVYVMEDGGGLPAVDEIAIDSDNDGVADQTAYRQHVLGGVFIPNASLTVSAGGTLAWELFDIGPLTLEPGTYWLSFVRQIGDTGNFYVGYGAGVHVTYIEGALNSQSNTIAFLIMSDETEPQDDGPLDNGDLIELANINFPLEAARAPLLALQAEESFYDLRSARLQNDTNGTYIDLTWPLTIDESITVDTKTHRIIDNETGLDIPFAGVPGNGVWPYNDAGANVWSWNETGATGLTIAIEHRGEWL